MTREKPEPDRSRSADPSLFVLPARRRRVCPADQVLLFEEARGPFAATRRSASLVRARWGAQLTAQATIGLAVFLACLPIGLVAGLACALGFGAVGVWTVLIVGLVAIDVISHALGAVLSAALYRYLHTGHLSAGYDEEELRAVFADKPAKR